MENPISYLPDLSAEWEIVSPPAETIPDRRWMNCRQASLAIRSYAKEAIIDVVIAPDEGTARSIYFKTISDDLRKWTLGDIGFLEIEEGCVWTHKGVVGKELAYMLFSIGVVTCRIMVIAPTQKIAKKTILTISESCKKSVPPAGLSKLWIAACAGFSGAGFVLGAFIGGSWIPL